MSDNDIKVIPGALGTSILIILWWVSLWIILEELIDYASSSKRHLKIAICGFVIVLIVVYSHVRPTFVHKL